MPAWGAIFSSQAGGEKTTQIRVEALADEVLRLREKPGASDRPK